MTIAFWLIVLVAGGLYSRFSRSGSMASFIVGICGGVLLASTTFGPQIRLFLDAFQQALQHH